MTDPWIAELNREREARAVRRDQQYARDYLLIGQLSGIGIVGVALWRGWTQVEALAVAAIVVTAVYLLLTLWGKRR